LKVLLINGSPNKDGCTFTALTEVAGALEANGIETEMFQIGTGAQRGCLGCGKCWETGKCVFDDDMCNELTDKIKDSDGIVVGSPVYYAGPNGALCALLDRVFFSASSGFMHKPAACIVSCRRGGASSAFDRLNKYFTITQMPVVSSQYWNAVHGNTPDEVRRDLEGMQIMRTIGNNMAWLIKTTKTTPPPKPETPRLWTNFHND